MPSKELARITESGSAVLQPGRCSIISRAATMDDGISAHDASTSRERQGHCELEHSKRNFNGHGQVPADYLAADLSHAVPKCDRYRQATLASLVPTRINFDFTSFIGSRLERIARCARRPSRAPRQLTRRRASSWLAKFACPKIRRNRPGRDIARRQDRRCRMAQRMEVHPRQPCR